MRIVTLSFALLFGLTVFAQEDLLPKEKKIKEINVNFNSIEYYSLVLKKEIDPNKYRRFGLALFAKTSTWDAMETVFSDNYIGLSYGIEKRRLMGENIFLVTGWECSFRGRGVFDPNTEYNVVQLSVGANAIIGLRYQINERFNVHLEYTPGAALYYATTSEGSGRKNGFGFALGGGTSNGVIGMGFRF